LKRVKRLDLETDKLSLNMESEAKSQTLQIPAKLYRIGELVSHTPFSRQTIHNYTIMGLIREVQWTEGGHRLYDESVFERLSKIIELKKTKTLWEIRQILNKEEAASKAASYCSRTENN
jgi:DNA-binding transcriptional MerR regulator